MLVHDFHLNKPNTGISISEQCEKIPFVVLHKRIAGDEWYTQSCIAEQISLHILLLVESCNGSGTHTHTYTSDEKQCNRIEKYSNEPPARLVCIYNRKSNCHTHNNADMCMAKRSFAVQTFCQSWFHFWMFFTSIQERRLSLFDSKRFSDFELSVWDIKVTQSYTMAVDFWP